MTKRKPNQNQIILDLLHRRGSVTAILLRARKIKNPSARIAELRKIGYRIKSVPYIRQDGYEAVRYTLY